MTFPQPRATTNPYLVLLCRSLDALPDVEVRYFSWREALLGRYDVLHAHWPEALLSGGHSLPARARRLVLTALLVLRLRLPGVRPALVRTVHNIAPHETLPPVRRWLLRTFERRTAVRIALNDRTPGQVGVPTVVVPHGHYREWYAAPAGVSPTAGRLTFFGAIRAYKGVDRLVTTFRDRPPTAEPLSLCVAGAPRDDDLRAAIVAAAADDPDVEMHLTFIEDDELAMLVALSELVVLPYREMHNSGAVLAALSLDRPVLIPRNQVNEDLAEEVGRGWVQLVEGEVTGADLVASLLRVRRESKAPRPDLSAREWPAAARAHRDVYRFALSRRGD